MTVRKRVLCVAMCMSMMLAAAACSEDTSFDTFGKTNTASQTTASTAETSVCETEPTETEPAETKTEPTETEPTETEPIDTEPTETEPTGPIDVQPTETEPTETEPTETTTTTSKTEASTTTKAASTTKAGTTTKTSSTTKTTTAAQQQQFKTSCGDYSALVKSIAGLQYWGTTNYKRGNYNTVYVHSFSQLYNVSLSVYPKNNADNLLAHYKQRGDTVGTITYQGKTVNYSINYLIPKAKLFNLLLLHMPIGNGYVKEIAVWSGGLQYAFDKNKGTQSRDLYVKNNQTKFKALSDDPKYYLFIFSAFQV